MNIVLLVTCFCGMAAMDLSGIIHEKQWRDLIIYGIFFVLVFALGMAVVMGIKVPSPIRAIQKFLQDVVHLSFQNS